MQRRQSFVFYGENGIFVTYTEMGDSMLVAFVLIGPSWRVSLYRVEPELESGDVSLVKGL